eukprot:6302308-Prymnesium_polylepis.1
MSSCSSMAYFPSSSTFRRQRRQPVADSPRRTMILGPCPQGPTRPRGQAAHVPLAPTLPRGDGNGRGAGRRRRA